MQVIRAWHGRFEAQELDLPAGAIVADALAATRITQAGLAGYAIHGERTTRDAPLRDGDRLELLEPLLADPKDNRRRRARVQAGKPPP
ncbi:RnfH family protein [Luteimonas saliphila]|uniref:RnfH family protein n=1 Tax=Luteimonas saliphila TaxID=2804919 RepID=UPI00307FE950